MKFLFIAIIVLSSNAYAKGKLKKNDPKCLEFEAKMNAVKKYQNDIINQYSKASSYGEKVALKKEVDKAGFEFVKASSSASEQVRTCPTYISSITP